MIVAVLVAGGCSRDTGGWAPVPANTDPVVFDDLFGDKVDYQAFWCSKIDAVSVDSAERFEGTASMKLTVPDPGNACAVQGAGWTGGEWSGGALTTSLARDLSGYNALTFMAKASRSVTLDVAGLGNDNTGTSLYEASWTGIQLTTNWQKFAIPIPLPTKLGRERGLFFLAEGPEGDKPMAFLDHVGELRNRLIRIVLAIAVGFFGSFYFAPKSD